MKLRWEFSGGPVVRAAMSLYSILGEGTKILQASRLGQKKKKKKQKNKEKQNWGKLISVLVG